MANTKLDFRPALQTLDERIVPSGGRLTVNATLALPSALAAIKPPTIRVDPGVAAAVQRASAPSDAALVKLPTAVINPVILADLSEGVLTITGTKADDKLRLVEGFGTIRVHTGQWDEALRPDAIKFPADEVRIIVIDAREGHDVVDTSAIRDSVRYEGIVQPRKLDIRGGEGRDTLINGTAQATLSGGAGDDRLVTRSRSNILDGGEGTDTAEAAGGGDGIRNCESIWIGPPASQLKEANERLRNGPLTKSADLRVIHQFLANVGEPIDAGKLAGMDLTTSSIMELRTMRKFLPQHFIAGNQRLKQFSDGTSAMTEIASKLLRGESALVQMAGDYPSHIRVANDWIPNPRGGGIWNRRVTAMVPSIEWVQIVGFDAKTQRYSILDGTGNIKTMTSERIARRIDLKGDSGSSLAVGAIGERFLKTMAGHYRGVVW